MIDQRLDIDPENLGKGLGRLVVAILDLLRQVLERQALRRVEDGSLTPDEIERLGQALQGLETRFVELREIFGISEETSLLSADDLTGGVDDANHRKQNAETK